MLVQALILFNHTVTSVMSHDQDGYLCYMSHNQCTSVMLHNQGTSVMSHDQG